MTPSSSVSVVVVEYPSAGDQTPDQLEEQLKQLNRCLAVREASLLHTYTSLDGTKLIRIFQAPDAGAVRYAHASAGFTTVTIWPATERQTL